MQNERKNKKSSNKKQEAFKDHVENQQEEKNPRHVREDVVEGYLGQEEEEKGEEKEENSWHVRENVVEGYLGQEEGEEGEEEEENPWHVRNKVVESYLEKEEGEEEEEEKQWYARKSIYDKDQNESDHTDKYQSIKKNVDDEEQQDDEEYEEQPESANQQSRLASHFNFMHQIRNQYKGFVAPAKEGSEHSSRSGFINQLWGQYKGFVAPAKEGSERSSRSDFVERLPSQYKEFVAAVSFLSILPLARKVTDADTDSSDPASSASGPGSVGTRFSASSVRIGSAYFPLVGLVIALITCLLLVIEAGLHLPSLVIAALVVITQVGLTGGLHLDGLMDTCDGLFYSGSRERKLEIMHDSRSGAFGILGAICILLLKFAILASLDLHHLTVGLLIVLPLARWALVLAMYAFPSALLTGLGAAARKSVTRSHIFIAAITSLLIALIVGQLVGLAIWVVGSLVALIVGIWMTYILNGLTGDTYGAIAEITEVVGLLVLVGMR